MFKKLEGTLGLPHLTDVLALVRGPEGKRVELILKRLQELSKDTESMEEARKLLELVRRLDEAGTLERLFNLLKELRPLTRGKSAMLLVEKLDKLEKLLQALLASE